MPPTTSVQAIEGLCALNTKYNGKLFKMIQGRNGYKVDLSYADYAATEAALIESGDMQLLVRLTETLLTDRTSNPQVADWLVENGFVEKRMLEIGNEIEGILAQASAGGATQEETDALFRRLQGLKAEIHAMGKEHAERARRGTILGGEDTVQ